MSVYDFTVKNLEGREVPLSAYRGKVLLILNTATHCGFTPQYTALQELYEKYQEKGLEILDFPCDQFGNQAPGTGEEIHAFCVSRFSLGFPQFEKIEVNGDNASPLFEYLKDSLPGVLGGAIKWNFTKFLVDREGVPVRRFAPQTTPEEIEKDILALL
jgi:glutathione peroxidase